MPDVVNVLFYCPGCGKRAVIQSPSVADPAGMYKWQSDDGKTPILYNCGQECSNVTIQK